MGRLGLVSLTLAFLVLAPLPAHAGSVWDANEPIHRLDIRWVGATMQADGRLRVTVTFYDQVRVRWFRQTESWWPSRPGLVVGSTIDRSVRPYMFIMFFRNQRGRLKAIICEGGSGCGPVTRVKRPNAITVRARFDLAPYFPHAGWFFRAWSANYSGEILDRTGWGVI
jgi:hypothetical protein